MTMPKSPTAARQCPPGAAADIHHDRARRHTGLVDRPLVGGLIVAELRIPAHGAGSEERPRLSHVQPVDGVRHGRRYLPDHRPPRVVVIEHNVRAVFPVAVVLPGDGGVVSAGRRSAQVDRDIPAAARRCRPPPRSVGEDDPTAVVGGPPLVFVPERVRIAQPRAGRAREPDQVGEIVSEIARRPGAVVDDRVPPAGIGRRDQHGGQGVQDRATTLTPVPVRRHLHQIITSGHASRVHLRRLFPATAIADAAENVAFPCIRRHSRQVSIGDHS
jgi:hypothetical protein